MTRLKISKAAVHGTLKCFVESGSKHNQADQKSPHHQNINNAWFTDKYKINFMIQNLPVEKNGDKNSSTTPVLQKAILLK